MQRFTNYSGIQYVIESDVFGTGDSPTEFIPIPENFTEPRPLSDYLVECPFCGHESQHELLVSGEVSDILVCDECKNEYEIEILGGMKHLKKVVKLFAESDSEPFMEYLENNYFVAVGAFDPR